VNWGQEVASANHPQIRHFDVQVKLVDAPELETKGQWEVCPPATAPNFTAVGYYYGRDLHQTFSVPIGLIHSSAGGSPARAWKWNKALQASLPEIFEAHKKAADFYSAKLQK
jgi:sialate O-acetylesterase